MVEVGIGVRLYDAAEVSAATWGELQEVQREALTGELAGKRSQEEIDEFISWVDKDHFYYGHANPNDILGPTNPNTSGGNYLYPDQQFTQPKVAIATAPGSLEPVGFAYSAHNVSGKSKLERRLKQATFLKNYLWLREVAVLPEYQHREVGTRLGILLLRDAVAIQSVTAYTYPDDLKSIHYELERLGFEEKGAETAYPFGDSTEPSTRVRLQAKTARGVLHKLHRPEARR